MTTDCGRSLSRSLHRVGIAITASGVLVTSGSHANPSDQIVLVSPRDLPELSRRDGNRGRFSTNLLTVELCFISSRCMEPNLPPLT